MNLHKTGLIVAALQVVLLGSIGAKFLIDRSQYPRVWVEAQPYDPQLPIRGRYVTLTAVTKLDESAHAPSPDDYAAPMKVRLDVRNGALVAVPDDQGHQTVRGARCGTQACWVLSEPLAYFIPEHVADPSRRKPGETLWVEATIPPNGPPRPIRLGVMADGKFSALDVD